MAVITYINFNGNCREAVEYYSQCFGKGKPQIMTYASMPSDPDFIVPEESMNLVMNASVNISDSYIMFSDVLPGMPFVAGNNISLAVVSKSMEEIKSLFNKLKEGGTVNMEIQKTFWSECFGSLTDKFGIDWQLSYDNK